MFGQFHERVSHRSNPIAQASAETVWPVDNLTAFHQARYCCIRNHALPDTREQIAFAAQAFCLLNYRKCLVQKRKPKIRGGIPAALSFRICRLRIASQRFFWLCLIGSTFCAAKARAFAADPWTAFNSKAE